MDAPNLFPQTKQEKPPCFSCSYGTTLKSNDSHTRQWDWDYFCWMLAHAAARPQKDGPWFSAALMEGRRSADNATRQGNVIILDLERDKHADSAPIPPQPSEVFKAATAAFGCCPLAVYTTFSHNKENPKMRVVIPVSRESGYEEWSEASRRAAALIGAEAYTDAASFGRARGMYLPAHAIDKEEDYECFFSSEGQFLDLDRLLAAPPTEEPNPEEDEAPDLSCLTPSPRYSEDDWGATIQKINASAFGAIPYEEWARLALSLHNIPEGHDVFMAISRAATNFKSAKDVEDKWRQTANGNGSVSIRTAVQWLNKNGIEVAKRHEAPASAPTTTGKVNTSEDHGGEIPGTQKNDKTGLLLNTIDNAVAMLLNHPDLKGKIAFNLFTGELDVLGDLPWHRTKGPWSDDDDSALRRWMEQHEGEKISAQKIMDALSVVSKIQMFHPVKDYFNSLHWDGTPRIDTLIIRHLGADDDELTRAVTRKWFVGAVSRIYDPGKKFDYCLMLQGNEGIGKSTLLNIMASDDWFSDNIEIEGRDALDNLLGLLICEFGELATLDKATTEAIKRFISATSDKFRKAYGRRQERHQRQCVFAATTNSLTPLRGDTGNRRFWVIRLNEALRAFKSTGESMTALKRDRNQLWAEAVAIFRKGEQLYLEDHLEAQMRERQKAANVNTEENDTLFSQLLFFLETKLPEDWGNYLKEERQRYFQNDREREGRGTVERQSFCIREFLEECARIKPDSQKYYASSRFIGKVMASMEGWQLTGPGRRTPYGVQKIYERVYDL